MNTIPELARTILALLGVLSCYGVLERYDFDVRKCFMRRGTFSDPRGRHSPADDRMGRAWQKSCQAAIWRSSRRGR